MNMRILNSIKVFQNLTQQERVKISESFQYVVFKADTVIINQGEEGKSFFILKEGKAKVRVDGKDVGELKSG
jgi:CRP-like cAMP-binding protein